MSAPLNVGSPVRGQPLLVFAAILGVWLVGRVLLWEPPYPLLIHPTGAFGQAGAGSPMPTSVTAAPGLRGADRLARAFAGETALRPVRNPAEHLPRMLSPDLRFAFVPAEPRAVAVAQPSAETAGPMPALHAAGHHMLLAAAFAGMALPPEIERFYALRNGSPATPGAQARLAAVADRPLLGRAAPDGGDGGRRWSGDAWLLWRDGSQAAASPGAVAYGRSQAGAVVRYRLAPGSRHRPAAYLRASSAIEGPRQAEAAAGLALRPLPAVPVSLAAEVRFGETDSGRQARPAVFAVTALPPAALPLGLRGEAYLQAGYVGGRYATAFVDGQVRVDRTVVKLDEENELRAGLGAWGGAQEGASRLDVGPSATLGLKLGEARSRVAFDYRLRIAGDAEPASGPALTFSAGF